MEEIIKIVKSLEDSELLLKGVSETIENEAKEKKKNRGGGGRGDLLLNYVIR